MGRAGARTSLQELALGPTWISFKQTIPIIVQLQLRLALHTLGRAVPVVGDPWPDLQQQMLPSCSGASRATPSTRLVEVREALTHIRRKQALQDSERKHSEQEINLRWANSLHLLKTSFVYTLEISGQSKAEVFHPEPSVPQGGHPLT